MKYFTLLQLNKSIQQLINGINRDFWIVAEISQAQVGTHAYLELVQKEEEQIVAKMRANVWRNQLITIHQKIGDDLGNLLKAGSKVLLKVQVNYHEIHGLALVVSEIDPSYTLGELEKRRQATIEALETSGLMQKQQLLSLPQVVQRIAVISSAEAAGYSDFVNQLAQNAYQYQFHLHFFCATVQGERAEKEIVAQLQVVQKQSFDAIIIIRGGGSKLDLEAFNSLAISEAIAQSETPVLTGIGHQRDTAVADLVAHQAFKTPTAVAEFLIQRMLHFESNLIEQFNWVLSQSAERFAQSKENLQIMGQMIERLARQRISRADMRLSNTETLLQRQWKQNIQQADRQINSIEKQIELLDPENILKKGYAFVQIDNKPIAKDARPQKGGTARIITSDWEISSIVEAVNEREPKTKK